MCCRGDLGRRQVADRRHDPPDPLARAAAVRRAGLGEHRLVVADRRRLGVADVGHVPKPCVRERAERLGGRRRRRSALAFKRELGLGRSYELRHAAACLELGHAAVVRTASTWPPSAGPVRLHPRGPPWPPAAALVVGAAPLDRPHRHAVRAEPFDEQERGRDRVDLRCVASRHEPSVLAGSAAADHRRTTLTGGPRGGPKCREMTVSSRFSATQIWLSRANRPAEHLLAMQKVEGSSPFSRSSESPGNPGLSWFTGLSFAVV